IFVNGPEPTGFGFVQVATCLAFEKMCFGTTNWAFRFAAMNWESGVLSVIRTVYGPAALIDARFVTGRGRPMMSIVLACLPALWTSSATVTAAATPTTPAARRPKRTERSGLFILFFLPFFSASVASRRVVGGSCSGNG